MEVLGPEEVSRRRYHRLLWQWKFLASAFGNVPEIVQPPMVLVKVSLKSVGLLFGLGCIPLSMKVVVLEGFKISKYCSKGTMMLTFWL